MLRRDAHVRLAALEAQVTARIQAEVRQLMGLYSQVYMSLGCTRYLALTAPQDSEARREAMAIAEEYPAAVKAVAIHRHLVEQLGERGLELAMDAYHHEVYRRLDAGTISDAEFDAVIASPLDRWYRALPDAELDRLRATPGEARWYVVHDLIAAGYPLPD